MFIVRDVIKDTKTGNINVYYIAKGRILSTPKFCEGYQREADARASIRRDMEGAYIVNEFESIECERWEHTYSIVNQESEVKLWDDMERAKDKLKNQVFTIMTKQALSEDEDDKKELQVQIETEIARFCIAPSWFEIVPLSAQIYEDLRRDWEITKHEKIGEHIEGLIDYISIEVKTKTKLNPIEARELRAIYSRQGYALTKIYEDNIFYFVKFN